MTTYDLIVVDLKRFDISCPHCALVDQDMKVSIGKNYQFLYHRTPPDTLDCAKVKLHLIPNLRMYNNPCILFTLIPNIVYVADRDIETINQILTGTLPTFWTLEQQCKFLKERIARR